MKVAVTATGPQLDAPMDPRFGRCPCFVIVETDDMNFEVMENASQSLGQGAGIQAARAVAERGVQHVLTGNCGPNAHQALSAAGIGVVLGCSGTVRQVVEQFKGGLLQAAAAPNVPGHSGLGQTGTGPSGTQTPGSAIPAASPNQSDPMVGGQGMGSGFGMGRGRGAGGGGGGGGRGRGGRGRGRCGGRGGNM